ncbi:MAG: hypothetical protein AAF849_03230 [Bacteroidota bacterium]
MKYIKHLIVSFTALIVLFSCESEDASPIQIDTELLFPDSQVLDIEQSLDEEGLPFFDISSVEDKIFSIVLTTEPLVVEKTQIENQDAIIWRWNSRLTATNIIQLADGVFKDAIFSQFPSLCELSKLDNLYWAAWAWDDSGTKILRSTPVAQINLSSTANEVFSILDVSVLDENGDSYLEAGEQVSMKITLNYTGKPSIKQFTANLQQANINELPFIISLEEVAQNPIPLDFTFTLPVNASYNDVIPLTLDLRFNDCSQQLQTSLTLTGRFVCLKSIKLVNIYTDPPNGKTWDDPNELWCHYNLDDIPASNPDPCYTFSSATLENVYSNCPSENSGQLIDADPRFPNQSWPAFVQCEPLRLNELYTIRVLDENRPWCEDNEFIGVVTFQPDEFLEASAPYQIVDSESIRVELELEWR